ncbi:MAG: IS630 family transposase [Acidobacteriaceae bacterium]|nr:IS630 family transposase [Acidobacteriaceae bacterium]MBV9937414.1 IS630 family transposase [Acidobacteriaceae bacterium]
MPTQIVIEIAPEEQARFRAELRHVRRGRWLALHILLLLALHRSPSEIAVVLLCARSTVYAVARDWQRGRRVPEPKHSVWPPSLNPSLRCSLLALLKKSPTAYGWCRTRWSCATLALQLEAQRGLRVSAETVRRCLHALDWVWKRAKLAAKDSAPERTAKLARIRSVYEHLGPREALLFADELDLHLLPKVGAQWMPRATQVEVMTPGKNERRHLAGALDVRTGHVHYCLWFRKVTGLFLDLLSLLDRAYPARHFDRIYVVADNYKIHKAKAVGRWLGQHPRFQLLFLPTYCPRANPIERCFGDLHDKVTRNHRRKRMRDLVADVERHLKQNGPWPYRLSEIYDVAEVTQTMKKQAPLSAAAVA